MASWKNIPIRETQEELIPVGPFTPYHFLCGSSIYYGERIDSPYHPDGLRGALLTHFIRKGVAERLKKASSLLPKGNMLWLWDSYRTLETQEAIFRWYQRTLATAHHDWEKNRVIEEAQRFVSLPSDDPKKPSPHTTGGSVDITLVRFSFSKWLERRILLSCIEMFTAQNQIKYKKIMYVLRMRLMDINRRYAQLLPMGTLFDEIKPETAAYYFEEHTSLNPQQEVIRENRALLRTSMSTAGFTSYQEEWWHYNYGNQMWAQESGAPYAIYGYATFSEKNKLWEKLRCNHFAQQKYWHEHDAPLPQNLRNETSNFDRKWARTFSNPTFSAHPKHSLFI